MSSPNTYCKVIVTAENLNRVERPTAHFPHHPQHLIDKQEQILLWESLAHIEETVDGGMVFDTVIVCNGEGAYQHWKSYDGKKTKNGKYIIIERPNNGGSFAGYNHVYRNTNYQNFVFTEDDIFIFGEAYYKRIVDEFNAIEGSGFLALVGISKNPKYTHCHGGVGFTTRDILKHIEDEVGDLPYSKTSGWNQRYSVKYGEYPFTNKILKGGFSLNVMSDYKRKWCKENLAYPYWLFNNNDLYELQATH